MSYTTLHFHATLRPDRREELRQQRHRRAADEARTRQQAEEAEGQRQVAEARTQLREQASHVRAQMHAHRDNLPAEAQAQLDALAQALRPLLSEARGSTDIATLSGLEGRLAQISHQAVVLLLRHSPDPAAASAQAPPLPGPDWERRRTAALVAQAALLRRLAGLHADEAVVTWSAAKLQAAGNICERIGQLLGEERWDEAATIADNAVALCDKALQQAEERQLQEEQRASLVAGLLDGLRQQELTVLDPELQRPGDLNSEVVLQVRRLARSLQVRVTAACLVTYEATAEDPTLWLVAHKAHHVVADGYGFDLAPAPAAPG